MANDAGLHPEDEYNRSLISNVHPGKWQNPQPQGTYNLVVIGAGTAGLITASGAAGLGAKVALIEKHLMGGDCLNVGCVPSKSIIRSARALYEVRNAKNFGVRTPEEGSVDFSAVMERMRKIRATMSPNDSAKRYRDLGVDVYFGEARFKGRDCVEVDGTEIKFKKAAITTGARASAPPVQGLVDAGFLTNETVFNLTELPSRLAVIGAGPIGCELAQTFARFGSKATLFDMAPRILIREDRDGAEIVEDQFRRDGVDMVMPCKLVKVEKIGPEKVITVEQKGARRKISVDEILVGAGRTPNVEGLNLEAAGVKYDIHGVAVNDCLQTTNRNIFAAGDICLKFKFTHTADASARIIIQNALFFGGKKVSGLVVPWCTYTDPEIAHVGMYEADAKQRGLETETFKQDLSEVDRAIMDGETQGFVKILVKKGSDQILGATVVAKHAGEMISEITTAMVGKTGLSKLASVIHPYPTQAEGIKRIADSFNRKRLKPWIKQMLTRWFSLRR